jgi:hypothetical protein
MKLTRGWKGAAKTAIAGAAILFLALRFLHLQADFPRHYTTSGVLYTDEGSYCNNAIAHALTGTWYVEGDFNPGVNLPVYPLVQRLSFALFGFGLSSARLTILLFFLALLLLLYLIIKRGGDANWFWLCLLLIAVNFNTFVYSRLALLEIPMTFFTMGSVALTLAAIKNGRFLYIFLAALSTALGLLTKTTAVFVIPIIFFILLYQENPIRLKLILCSIYCFFLGILLCFYYAIIVSPHLADYQFYYATNIYTRTQDSLFQLVRGFVKAVYYGKDIDLILYPLVMIFSVALFLKDRSFRKSLLVWICLIWIGVYLMLIGSQDYVPSRFYAPMIVPVAVLAVLILNHLRVIASRPFFLYFFAAALFLSVAFGGARILNYVCHPEYTWMYMTNDLKAQIAADRCKAPVLLGHFSNSITLATGIPSVNEQFGTNNLDYRITRYHPNYYVCLGEIKPNVRTTLQKYFTPRKIKAYDVYNNYLTGEPVVLYRLETRPDSTAALR